MDLEATGVSGRVTSDLLLYAKLVERITREFVVLGQILVIVVGNQAIMRMIVGRCVNKETQTIMMMDNE